MTRINHRPKARTAVSLIIAGTLMAACQSSFDTDLRGSVGGFSTSTAAQTATGQLPRPDARGVISYPTYQVAVAKRGDTIADVAGRVGLDAGELARFNTIDPNRPLNEGEIIALPRRVAEPTGTSGSVDIAAVAGAAIESAQSGSTSAPTAPAPQADQNREPVRHKVARGETAYTIARLYDVPVRALADWNGLSSDFSVREGQYLLIPTVVSRTEVSTDSQPGQGTATPLPPSSSSALPDEQIAAASENNTPDVSGTAGPTTISSAMIMPVDGTVIRDYSRGKNNGIDISAGAKAPVKAAASGKVAGITQDTNKVSIVILEHSDGLLTIYVGVGDVAVSKGAQVKRGQTIANLPDEPNATLHFEVRQGIDNVVDPSKYLGG